MRLIKGWDKDDSKPMSELESIAAAWLEAKFNAVIKSRRQFYRVQVVWALITIYSFIWDDFCSWYLEMIKPAQERKRCQAETMDKTICPIFIHL